MFTVVTEERATSVFFREEEASEQPVPFCPEEKQYVSPKHR
jgi:hypothetical protein